MAVYKVIQDIEADDKLLGPLTLRQFVYAGIAVFCLYLCVFVATHGAPFLIPILLVPAFIASFFAFPWSREQPTELWALARIRFLIKPRKRVWDQTGIKELVTITAPKHVEHVYSDGLSQSEVRSRLKALADTIDTRGWAIKNTAVNPYAMPAFINTVDTSERLIDPAAIPNDVSMAGSDIYTDMLDPAMNPQAQQFDSMLEASAEAHREHIMASLQPTAPASSIEQPADYWFLNQTTNQHLPKGHTVFGSDVVTPGTQDDSAALSRQEEQALVEQLRTNEAKAPTNKSHMPTILPLEEQEKRAKELATKAEAERAMQQATSVTAPTDAAILELARNDDLTIDTIKRQAKKVRPEDASDEVVISLH